jgi:hypothetical protein
MRQAKEAVGIEALRGQGEYERWQRRDLSARRYVYVWADGVFLRVPAWKTTASVVDVSQKRGTVSVSLQSKLTQVCLRSL